MPQENILSFEEIAEVVNTGVSLGITKLRLTGGEPLVRKNIADLVYLLKNTNGVEEVSMTTNGVLLSQFAEDLKTAGLDRINISLDTLNESRFQQLTGFNKLNDVIAGILQAEEVGIHPIKINFVKHSHSTKEDEFEVQKFCSEHGFHLRYIRQMDLSTGEYSQVEGGIGGNCKLCNRIRLSADGYLKPCLHSNEQFHIKEFGIEQAFRMAILNKPKCGTGSTKHKFYNIGG